MPPRKSFKFNDNIIIRSVAIRMPLRRVLIVCHLIILLVGLSSGQHHHAFPEPSTSHNIVIPNRIENDIHGKTLPTLERISGYLTRKEQGNLVQTGKKTYKNQDDGTQEYTATGLSGKQHQNANFNDKGLFKEYQGRKSTQTAKKSGNTRSGNSISAAKKKGGKSGKSSSSSRHKLHKKDYILTDKIHYGFDKKFNKEEVHDGVYKALKHKDDHTLEDFNDKRRDFRNFLKARNSASSGIGSQRALRESSKRAGSGSHASKIGDYYDNQNKKKQAGAHSDVYGAKLDFNAGGDHFLDQKEGRLSKTNGGNSFTNRSTGRGKQETRLGGSTLFGSRNYGEAAHHLAGKNGQRLRAGASLFGHSVGAAEGLGRGFSKFLAEGKEGFKSGTRKGFNTNNNQRDHREGRYNQGQLHTDRVANHRSNNVSGKNKTTDDHQYADASKYYKNSDGSLSKLKTLHGSTNSKKNLVDRVSNDKETKVFHTSKKVKGDNYELLDFDRKKFEKDRVKDNFDQSSDDQKYDSKFRILDNKGKRFSRTNASAGHKHSSGDIKQGGHAITTKKKSASGNQHLKTNKGGKSTFDHHHKGNGEFGYKTAHANNVASRGGSGLAFMNKSNGNKQSLQKAAFVSPKHLNVEHPISSHQETPKAFSTDYGLGFGQSNFGVPSQQFGNSFSRFHNPHQSFGFGGKETDNFYGNSENIRQSPHIDPDSHKAYALPKSQILVTTPAKHLESNHRSRAITNTSPFLPSKLREKQQLGDLFHPHNKVYGNYESVSMSKLFSGNVFGSDISDSFPSFDDFF